MNINRIINKKGKLTGKEVGQALLYQLCTSYLNVQQAVEDKELDPHTSTKDEVQKVMDRKTFTMAEVDRMVSTLDDNYQIDEYNKFVSISNFVKMEMGYANTYMMQAQCGIFRINGFLSNVLNAERVIEEYLKLPLIVTQKQYDYYKAKADEKQNAEAMCFFDIYSAIANNYISLYFNGTEEEAYKNNPLAAVFTDYEQRTFTSEEYLKRYYARYKHYNGHYLIKGTDTDSEKLEQEEWVEELREIIAKIKNEIDLDDYTELEEELMEALDFQKIRNEDSLFYQYLEWEDYEEQEEIEEQGLYQIIGCYDIFDYPALSLKELKAEYKAFRKDFTELDEAILSVMYELFPAAQEIRKAEKYKEVICTWGDIIDRGILQNEVCSALTWQIAEQIEDYTQRYRAGENGFSIIQEYDFRTDERGFYKEPNLLEHTTLAGLDFIADSDSMIEAIEDTYSNQLIEGMKELYASSEVLRVTSEHTGVSELSVFFQTDNIEFLEEKIESYNMLNKIVRLKIQQNVGYLGIGEAEKRYKAFCSIFPYIDIDSLRPTESNKQAVKDLIKRDKEAFTNHSSKLGQLMYRREEEEGVLDDEE